MRGDWQLLPWILGQKGNEPGRQQTTRIPVHGRWKMLDNLRRSLAAPAAFLLLVAAWTLPGASALLWTGLWLAAIVLPAFMPVLDGLVPRRQGFSKRSHLRDTGGDVQVALLQVVSVSMDHLIMLRVSPLRFHLIMLRACFVISSLPSLVLPCVTSFASNSRQFLAETRHVRIRT